MFEYSVKQKITIGKNQSARVPILQSTSRQRCRRSSAAFSIKKRGEQPGDTTQNRAAGSEAITKDQARLLET